MQLGLRDRLKWWPGLQRTGSPETVIEGQEKMLLDRGQMGLVDLDLHLEKQGSTDSNRSPYMISPVLGSPMTQECYCGWGNSGAKMVIGTDLQLWGVLLCSPA